MDALFLHGKALIVGTHLGLFVTDAREDTYASRLCRLMEALDAWGHVERDAWTVDVRHDGREADVERARQDAEQRTKLRFGERMDAAGARALVEAMGTTVGLTLIVPSAITHLYLTSCEARRRRQRGLPDLARSVAARMDGDLEIDMHKVGRRCFEGAWSSSDEVQALLGAAEEARAARSFDEAERLSSEAAALADRVLDERRLLMLDLFATLAARFEPASVKAYLDFEDYIPPRATMAYYQSASAVTADLALLVDADAVLTSAESPAYLEHALGRVSSAGEAQPTAEMRALRARLRAITQDEVTRIASTMTAWVMPMAGGWLVSNPDFDPVGRSIAPFFEALIAGAPPR
ncbi:Hypothetical protein A7982_02296 [Minicystis rosea]|nr:Hypothetical protein A7982_02296 [Minicystis rosea]